MVSFPRLNDSYQRIKLRTSPTGTVENDTLEAEIFYESGLSLPFVSLSTTGATTPASTMPIGANLPYGSMYLREADGDITVSIASDSTWYEVASGTIGGEEHLTTFQNSHEIKVSLDGKYEINWSMALATSTTNDEVVGAVGNNGTAIEESANRSTVANGGSYVSVSGHTIQELTADDVISLFVKNKTAARDITIEHATCTLRYLGP